MPDNSQYQQAPGIGLWRKTPRYHSIKAGDFSFPACNVFPSGRQALSYALCHAGLGRPHRVAFPEWSSHCVISTLGKYVTPVPMREAADNKLSVQGILVYEQWGWSLPACAWKQLAERYPGVVLILDRVDSSDFFYRMELPVSDFKSIAHVVSWWKILGLTGGGILHFDGKYVPFKPEPISNLTQSLAQRKDLNEFDYTEYFKNQAQMVHPAVMNWNEQNCAIAAVEDERLARRQNILRLQSSSLAHGWPGWMLGTLDAGGGPGIAPVLRGMPRDELTRAVDLLAQAGVNATLYHFNWSGNPLEPAYELCVALPVHSMMPDIDGLVRIIERKI